jgi:hypothetical protein
MSNRKAVARGMRAHARGMTMGPQAEEGNCSGAKSAEALARQVRGNEI